MSLKHRLKGTLRSAYTAAVWRSGLHRAVDRMSTPRLLILYGHCVAAPKWNASLDADMKIDAAKLTSILRTLGERYDFVTIGEGVDRLDRLRDGDASAPRRSMVALSMDDGYRDNLHELVPLLHATGARATVFLEAGAVVDRTLPWLHRLGWLTGELGWSEAAARLAIEIPPSAEALTNAGSANGLKRVLKYDADLEQRDAALSRCIAAEGGDERAILDALYLSHDEARALAADGAIEIGGHTVEHPVLSRLTAEEQRLEVATGADKLEGLLGSATRRTFAYPYGRNWDFDDASPAAIEAAGFRAAVTTHAGTNRAGTDRYRLARWPIHNAVDLGALATEASGGFDVARRIGIDLVE